MAADHFGQRYITQSQFVDHAKSLGLDDSRLEDVIQFAERFCILTPAARVRFPGSIVRRWHEERYPRQPVLKPIEVDGPRLAAATTLRNALSRDLMGRTEFSGTGEHPLDSLADEQREFVTNDFARSTFTPWEELRTPLFEQHGTIIKGSEGTFTYYHSWQVFQLAAFLRSGLSVLYDLESQTWDEVTDLRRDDVYMVANLDTRHELKTLRANAELLDAVTEFEDRCNRALQVHARGNVDQETRRMSPTATRIRRPHRPRFCEPNGISSNAPAPAPNHTCSARPLELALS